MERSVDKSKEEDEDLDFISRVEEVEVKSNVSVDLEALDDSFDSEPKRKVKRLPKTIAEILNPDVRTSLKGPIIQNLPKSDPPPHKLFEMLLDEIVQFVNGGPFKLDESKYEKILPNLPPIYAPYIKKIPQDNNIKPMDVSVELIIDILIQHITSFERFINFDVSMIPDKIKQDVFESTKELSLNKVYLAKYSNLYKTLLDLYGWSKNANQGGWLDIFKQTYQERFEYKRHLIEKTFYFVALLLTFYSIALQYYKALKNDDLVDYWTRFTLKERQGQAKVVLTDFGAKDFVYKYTRKQPTKSKKQKQKIVDEDEEEQKVEEQPIVIPPKQKTNDILQLIKIKPDSIAHEKYTVYYTYYFSALINELKKIFLYTGIKQEYGLPIAIDARFSEWKQKATNSLDFVRDLMTVQEGSDLHDMYLMLENALQSLT
jgi:hypothetical protein